MTRRSIAALFTLAALFVVVAALLLPAKAKPATAAGQPNIHCLVFRWEYIGGTWVLLDQKPIGEVPCPSGLKRSRKT